jgi:hypothetical protein
MRLTPALSLLFIPLLACRASTTSSSSSPSDAGTADGATSAIDASKGDYLCTPGTDLTGATWTLAASRFDFGSTPVVSADGSRYTGTDGVVAISAVGGAQGLSSASSPAMTTADYSADVATQTTATVQYLEGFQIAPCQVGTAQVHSLVGPGISAEIILLPRVVDSIPIANSIASARLDANNQTDNEQLYWPTIPAAIVTEARAFYARTADPTQLQAYKALLPANAQGTGLVAIHHTNSIGAPPVRFAVTWDVDSESPQSFDENGNVVDLTTL